VRYMSRGHGKFVAYAPNINDFKLGYHMILFVDGCHLSGPYKGTMLVACAFDVDNHTSILRT